MALQAGFRVSVLVRPWGLLASVAVFISGGNAVWVEKSGYSEMADRYCWIFANEEGTIWEERDNGSVFPWELNLEQVGEKVGRYTARAGAMVDGADGQKNVRHSGTGRRVRWHRKQGNSARFAVYDKKIFPSLIPNAPLASRWSFFSDGSHLHKSSRRCSKLLSHPDSSPPEANESISREIRVGNNTVFRANVEAVALTWEGRYCIHREASIVVEVATGRRLHSGP